MVRWSAGHDSGDQVNTCIPALFGLEMRDLPRMGADLPYGAPRKKKAGGAGFCKSVRVNGPAEATGTALSCDCASI